MSEAKCFAQPWPAKVLVNGGGGMRGGAPGPPIAGFATASLSKLNWWRSIPQIADRVLLCSQLDESFQKNGVSLSPHHPIKGPGSVVSFPSWVRGRAPAENGIYAYLRLPGRSYLEHLFQYFWTTAPPLQHHGALENFPSPSRRTCQFPKPKTKGRQIWPPHQAAKGPATPLMHLNTIDIKQLWAWCVVMSRAGKKRRI